MRHERTEHEPPVPALESGPTVCVRCGRAGYRISVNMSETTPAGIRPAQQTYVHRVLHAYVAMPETPARWHSMDRQMALELFGRRIPLDVIQTAFVLGSARRLARDPRRIVPPIRCLAYFLPVIEEVLADPPPPDYIRYLERTRIRPAQKTLVQSNTT